MTAVVGAINLAFLLCISLFVTVLRPFALRQGRLLMKTTQKKTTKVCNEKAVAWDLVPRIFKT